MFLYDVFRVVKSSAPNHSDESSKIVAVGRIIPAENSSSACKKAQTFARKRYNGRLELSELVALQGDKVEDKRFK